MVRTRGDGRRRSDWIRCGGLGVREMSAVNECLKELLLLGVGLVKEALWQII